TADTISYPLLPARLKVLTGDDNNRLLKIFSSELQAGNYQNKEATRYGFALALQANKKYKQALQQTRLLLKKNPEQITYNLLKAKIETDARQYSAAIKTFQKLLKSYPGNNTINVCYAETLLKANKINLAHKILQAQISSSTKTPKLYRLLAETQARLNEDASSHLSLAEHYYLLGQTHDAIKQLEIGLKIPKINFYLTSRIEARLKEFKNELVQLSPK
ncbi:MAG: tetratricopeptide repeat protein, partial [Kangiellaceae bacterium]|nr:tetratricopeptide repeat protein [Kangiellaceae bacterium]